VEGDTGEAVHDAVAVAVADGLGEQVDRAGGRVAAAGGEQGDAVARREPEARVLGADGWCTATGRSTGWRTPPSLG
jgi:hypothetical protein